MTEEDKRILETLFPEREIDLRGVKITVRPLSLADLPKALDAFDRLIMAVRGGTPKEKLATSMIRELLELVPYSTDIKADKLPGTLAAPELLKAIVELNMSDDVVGKWQALMEQVKDQIQVEGLGNLLSVDGQGDSAPIPNKE